ncbi:ComF family protein [Candidatus Protochlamydia amoebophila]|nr:ComF family protein [Candidatus Protochlamydia amoebophila]
MYWWQEIKKSWIHFVFPATCLYCKESLQPSQAVFCYACASLLELINPQERCPICFDLKKNTFIHKCERCKAFPSLFLRQASAFDYFGPAQTLVKQLKYGNQAHLAKGMAAFLMTQFDRLKWPLPDIIVPVPMSFSHWLKRGYNQSFLLAEEMAKILHIPLFNCLKYTSGNYGQASLNLGQRKQLKQVFKLKKTFQIQDKRVLLIDDVMTTGTTLHKCAEALSEGFPGTLYALTFCRTTVHD